MEPTGEYYADVSVIDNEAILTISEQHFGEQQKEIVVQLSLSRNGLIQMIKTLADTYRELYPEP